MLTDPLHQRSGPTTAWTTVNAAEAMPGVLTPLGISFWLPACELGLRAAFRDFGVLAPAEVRVPDRIDARISGVFHGRYAANVDVLRSMADLTPGSSGDQMERQLFGSVREGVARTTTRRRYPVVAVKAPRAVVTLPRQLRLATEAWDAAWRSLVASASTAPEPRLLAQAQQNLTESLRTHMLATMLGQAAFDNLCKLAAKAGRPGLELTLAGGYGSLEESRLVSALWAVRDGATTMAAFQDEFGFHGPDEGELSSVSWREDPAPVQALVESYRALPDSARPESTARERVAAREQAEAELLAALPRTARGGAKLALRFARAYLPMREVSKANFLKSIDSARAAARGIGVELHRQSTLDAADDVYYLTVDEVVTGPPRDARELVTFRRGRRAEYLTLQLPEFWVGEPPRLPVEPLFADSSGSVRGIAASQGQATGRVRVIADIGTDELFPGEILVCETTDPSWSAAFPLASAVVIDVGGVMSHGAIVAREFGIPCVINTRTGTSQLTTGDLVEVDGTAGTVTVLERAAACG